MENKHECTMKWSVDDKRDTRADRTVEIWRKEEWNDFESITGLKLRQQQKWNKKRVKIKTTKKKKKDIQQKNEKQKTQTSYL